jgi:hypothetical protein
MHERIIYDMEQACSIQMRNMFIMAAIICVLKQACSTHLRNIVILSGNILV